MTTNQITIGDVVKVQGRGGFYQVNKIDGEKVQLLAGGINLIVSNASKLTFVKKSNFKGI